MLKSDLSTWGRVASVLALAVAASACDVTVGAVDYKVREEKRFPVSGAARVNLSTFDGAIEVQGWDRSEVLIEVEKQAPDQATADSIKVDARQDGNLVTVQIPEPGSFGSRSWHQAPSARIIASVPLQTELVVRSGDGSVTLRRVNGKQDIRTEDGSIRVDDAKGAWLLRTGDGSVTLDDIDGDIDVQTDDGSIRVDGVVKAVRLDTNDGSIRFTARNGSAADAEWSITTGDGSVRGELPKGFNAEIDAESRSGRVTVEGLTGVTGRLDQDDERETRRKRRSARGTLGTGGKLVKLRTGDGSISVQVW